MSFDIKYVMPEEIDDRSDAESCFKLLALQREAALERQGPDFTETLILLWPFPEY